jgi:hypothetical protein
MKPLLLGQPGLAARKGEKKNRAGHSSQHNIFFSFT